MPVKGSVTGRISRAGKLVRPEGKKPFAACSIKDSKTFNGKTFDNYIDCLVYRDCEEIVGAMVEGSIASMEGDVQPNMYEGKDGKSRACLKIVGQMTIFNEGEAQPEQQTSTQSQTSQASPQDDDVPF